MGLSKAKCKHPGRDNAGKLSNAIPLLVKSSSWEDQGLESDIYIRVQKKKKSMQTEQVTHCRRAGVQNHYLPSCITMSVFLFEGVLEV